jgi:hypothetical protein
MTIRRQWAMDSGKLDECWSTNMTKMYQAFINGRVRYFIVLKDGMQCFEEVYRSESCCGDSFGTDIRYDYTTVDEVVKKRSFCCTGDNNPCDVIKVLKTWKGDEHPGFGGLMHRVIVRESDQKNRVQYKHPYNDAWYDDVVSDTINFCLNSLKSGTITGRIKPVKVGCAKVHVVRQWDWDSYVYEDFTLHPNGEVTRGSIYGRLKVVSTPLIMGVQDKVRQNIPWYDR